MKFELKAANQRIPDGDLLADLRRVADLIGSATLVKSAYDTHGRFYRGTIASRFGSWQDALRRAGLEPQSVTTPKELLSDLQRVARELNRNYLPFKEYRRLGKWSERPFVRVFEDWQTALSTAGLDQHPNLKQRATMEDLFSNLEAVWIAIGRQPTYAEMVRPLSKFGATTYAKHFGGWRSALERFIEWVNSPDSEEPRPAAEQLGESPATPNPAAPVLPVRRSRRTPRTANLHSASS